MEMLKSESLPWSQFGVKTEILPPSDWLYIRDGVNIGRLDELDTIRLLKEKYGWGDPRIKHTLLHRREIKCGLDGMLYRTKEQIVQLDWLLDK